MVKARCAWAGDDPLVIAYHDQEWGMPHQPQLLGAHHGSNPIRSAPACR
jgi:hypothetical protein